MSDKRVDVHISVTVVDANTGKVEDGTAKVLGNITMGELAEVAQVLEPILPKIGEINARWLRNDIAAAAAVPAVVA